MDQRAIIKIVKAINESKYCFLISKATCKNFLVTLIFGQDARMCFISKTKSQYNKTQEHGRNNLCHINFFTRSKIFI